MLGLIYLCVSILFGITLMDLFVNTRKIYASIGGRYSSHRVLKLLFVVPAGAVFGMMFTTFVNYYIILAFNMLLKGPSYHYPLGIILTMAIVGSLTFLQIKKLKKRKEKKVSYSRKTMIFYGIVSLLWIIVPAFLMFYSYRLDGKGILHVGYTVFSDLSPHTAMVSSFGIGSNVPTQYMHFPGDGIKWHFFFYFFCGILRYLGVPIDFALNLPSIIVMGAALMLVGLLANLISKNQWAYLIAPILVLFRSALNIFYEIHKLCVANEPVLKSLLERQEWTDTTPYDVWGLWSINVYPNQRHLMLGVSVLLILVIFFMPYIKEMFQSLRKKKWKEKIKSFLFSKEAWIEKSEDHRIFLAWCFAFMLPYFHGSALIACLLVLCMFAIFSKNRLSYLVFAIIAIISSVLQTSLFSAGASNVVNFQWRLGFVVEEVTFPEIMNYCFIITGIAFILAFLYVLMKWKDRIPVVLLISFLVPFIFTFLVKITTEITANHKFIQFSIILMDTLIAGFMADLFVRKESLDV